MRREAVLAAGELGGGPRRCERGIHSICYHGNLAPVIDSYNQGKPEMGLDFRTGRTPGKINIYFFPPPSVPLLWISQPANWLPGWGETGAQCKGVPKIGCLSARDGAYAFCRAGVPCIPAMPSERYCSPGTTRTCCECFASLLCSVPAGGKRQGSFHSTEGQNKALRSEVTCSRSHDLGSHLRGWCPNPNSHLQPLGINI